MYPPYWTTSKEGTYQILPYFLSIIGNRISYYTKKLPAGWHEVSLYLPDVESLILLNWKIIFIYVTMIISAGR